MALEGFVVPTPLQLARPQVPYSSVAPAGHRSTGGVPLLAATATALGLGSARQQARRRPRCRSRALPASVPPAPTSSVIIKADADAVASSLCKQVAEAAKTAVAERGAFAIAIPGGSILKMLVTGASELEGVEWDKGVMAYVNHKCVSNDDAAATHQKATDLFLSGWQGLKVITMGGSNDGEAEAKRYEEELRALPETTLPRKDGMPVFDICLIGVGDDGHFGSLYPGRQEIGDESGRWVLAVDMKSPPSITLAPKAMMAAKTVLVASAGVSEKYPMGKSEAMKTAIEGTEGPQAFPAQVLRSTAQWLLDQAAASKLSSKYQSS